MNQAEAKGQEEQLKQIFRNVLNREQFNCLSTGMKDRLVKILFAMKMNKLKVRLALVNFHSLMKGESGEDVFLGLELDATN
jgi:hypothetical protein